MWYFLKPLLVFQRPMVQPRRWIPPFLFYHTVISLCLPHVSHLAPLDRPSKPLTHAPHKYLSIPPPQRHYQQQRPPMGPRHLRRYLAGLCLVVYLNHLGYCFLHCFLVAEEALFQYQIFLVFMYFNIYKHH